MSNKEKVLAYFEEWAGKGVNLSNEISVIVSNHGMACIDWCDESVFSFPLESGTDLAFMRAARILKLDPPQAAPIKWREEHMGFISDCGLYRITKGAMGGVWIDFRHTINVAFSGTCCELFIANPETVESSKSECQAHKQKRFNQLGGYNV